MVFGKGKQKDVIPWNKGTHGIMKAWNKGTKGLCSVNSGSFKKGDNSGEKAWNYRGATSLNKLLRASAKFQIWRNLVFIRDDFICQNKNCDYCNNKIGVFLHPHHKKPLAIYPELAFDVDNGITYCKDFHLKSGLHEGILREVNK